MENPLKPDVIGLLYPGEMGTALARLLHGTGVRLVTTLAGRGPNTCRSSRAAGLEELDSLRAVLQSATVVLAVVPPAVAMPLAQQCRAQLIHRPATAGRLLYLDLNSVAPATARNIAAVFDSTPVEFVDGGIFGPASQLASRGVMYLSGALAPRAAALFEGKMRVQVAGEQPGQASTMRMLLSGLAKGIVALFVEMALGARRAGVLEQLKAAYQASYPGVMEFIERSLPTYPRHAVRRSQEMTEVETTLTELGLCLAVTPGVRRLITDMGRLRLDRTPDRTWSVAAVISELHERNLLGQTQTTVGCDADCATVPS
jgi:3-hydroxyisobutyrate dehydrogenase-like beta-hydroxyacid dehydrogenase